MHAVAGEAILPPTSRPCTAAHSGSGSHSCFASDGEALYVMHSSSSHCIQRLEVAETGPHEVSQMHASPAALPLGPHQPAGTEPPPTPQQQQPIHLLAASPSGPTGTAAQHPQCSLVAAAAGATLRIFEAGPGSTLQAASELREPSGSKWLALAWSPDLPNILAVASQVEHDSIPCPCCCRRQALEIVEHVMSFPALALTPSLTHLRDAHILYASPAPIPLNLNAGLCVHLLLQCS